MKIYSEGWFDRVKIAWGNLCRRFQGKRPYVDLKGQSHITCGAHGRWLWTGEVICTECDAVWHLNVHNPPKHGHCTCGAKLTGEEGSARAICPACYRRMRAVRGET